MWFNPNLTRKGGGAYNAHLTFFHENLPTFFHENLPTLPCILFKIIQY